MDEALEKIEALRTEVANPDLRASFLSSRREAFTLLIDVLMAMHAETPEAKVDHVALAISERARARRLLDLLAQAEVDLDDGEPELAEQQRDLVRRLSLLVQRHRLISAGRQRPAPGEDLAATIADVHAQLDLVATAGSRSSTGLVTTSPPTLSTVQTVQQLLDSQTTLLHYSLGDPHSYLWVVSPSRLDSFVLPPRGEIEDAARRLHELLSTLGSTSRDVEAQAARSFTEMMLGPAMESLAGNRPDATPSRRIQLAESPPWIVLVLELSPPFYPSYRVTIERLGKTLWESEGLQLGERDSVTLSLGAGLLAPGDQQATSRGDHPRGPAGDGGLLRVSVPSQRLASLQIVATDDLARKLRSTTLYLLPRIAGSLFDLFDLSGMPLGVTGKEHEPTVGVEVSESRMRSNETA